MLLALVLWRQCRHTHSPADLVLSLPAPLPAAGCTHNLAMSVSSKLKHAACAGPSLCSSDGAKRCVQSFVRGVLGKQLTGSWLGRGQDRKPRLCRGHTF